MEAWNNYVKLKFVKGHNFGHGDVVAVPAIEQNQTTDITVAMTAPSIDGLYESQWRMITIAGAFCGSMYINSCIKYAF